MYKRFNNPRKACRRASPQDKRRSHEGRGAVQFHTAHIQHGCGIGQKTYRLRLCKYSDHGVGHIFCSLRQVELCVDVGNVYRRVTWYNSERRADHIYFFTGLFSAVCARDHSRDRDRRSARAQREHSGLHYRAAHFRRTGCRRYHFFIVM